MDKVFNSEASIASAKKALSVFEENIMAAQRLRYDHRAAAGQCREYVHQQRVDGVDQ